MQTVCFAMVARHCIALIITCTTLSADRIIVFDASYGFTNVSDPLLSSVGKPPSMPFGTVSIQPHAAMT
ncbi:MAG: hypothetical protein AAF065_05960 [Verrucomicrobiota bacterium]